MATLTIDQMTHPVSGHGVTGTLRNVLGDELTLLAFLRHRG